MPKAPTLPRAQVEAPPTRPTRRTRARATSPQIGQSYPKRVGNTLRPSSPATQQRPPEVLRQGPGNGAQERAEDDPVHIDCLTIIRKADNERAQLVAQLAKEQEAAEAARRDTIRFQARLRKLTSVNHALRVKIDDLQKRFDESTPDTGAYVLRVEHEHILNELGRLSSSMTRKIELRKSESENVSMTKDLPPSDALQSPWVPGEFDVLDDPIIPDDVAPMLSTSEALALPNFGTYGEMS